MTFAAVVLFGGRILGGLQILMGFALWAGMASVLFPVHILNGILITVLLFAAAWIGHRSGSAVLTTVFAAAWALMLPVYGLAHAALLPGSLHWIVQVTHLLVGLVALVLIERLARRARGSGAGRRMRGAVGQ